MFWHFQPTTKVASNVSASSKQRAGLNTQHGQWECGIVRYIIVIFSTTGSEDPGRGKRSWMWKTTEMNDQRSGALLAVKLSRRRIAPKRCSRTGSPYVPHWIRLQSCSWSRQESKWLIRRLNSDLCFFSVLRVRFQFMTATSEYWQLWRRM